MNLAGDNWRPGESVHVFLDTAEPATRVRFHLDSPTTGTPFRIEGTAPWDFAGGDTATAFPYSNALSAGSHTITAVMTRPDGSTATATATFTVGTSPPPPPAPDTTRPSIQSFAPADGSTGAAVGSRPVVTFSEPVVPNGGVALATVAGAPVPATVTVSGAAVTLTPVAPLAAATAYRVTVSAAVSDTAGNPVTAAGAATFTTAAATPPTTTPPTTTPPTTTPPTTTPPAPAGAGLKVSRSATRSPAVPLAGDTWARAERVHVFLDTTGPAVSVRFYLDTPGTGTPFRIEGAAPWDFAGGGTATAFPYNNALAAGPHTITAVVTRPDGTTQATSASFTVT